MDCGRIEIVFVVDIRTRKPDYSGLNKRLILFGLKEKLWIGFVTMMKVMSVEMLMI